MMKWKNKIEVKNLQAGGNEMFQSSCLIVLCATKVAKWIQTKNVFCKWWNFQNISYIFFLQKTAKKDEEEELTDDEMKEKNWSEESSSRR